MRCSMWRRRMGMRTHARTQQWEECKRLLLASSYHYLSIATSFLVNQHDVPLSTCVHSNSRPVTSLSPLRGSHSIGKSVLGRRDIRINVTLLKKDPMNDLTAVIMKMSHVCYVHSKYDYGLL